MSGVFPGRGRYPHSRHLLIAGDRASEAHLLIIRWTDECNAAPIVRCPEWEYWWKYEEYLLNQPWLGLYLPPRVWRTLYKCAPDAVLLAFASHEYDPDDYIRDYDDFMRIVQETR